MEQHALDLLHAALWLLGAFGTICVSLLGYGGSKFLGRMDEQDCTLLAIKDLLQSEIGKLRDLHHSIDIRVTQMECKCALRNAAGQKAQSPYAP